MTKLRIDKNIPIPEKATWVREDERVKYPFDKMQPGDSFLLPMGKYPSVRAYVSRMNSLKKKHFIVRKDETGTYRCWRIK